MASLQVQDTGQNSLLRSKTKLCLPLTFKEKFNTHH